MAIRTDFAAGEVLAAADLNDTFGAKLSTATAASTYLPIAGGKILQIVRATNSTTFTTTSTSYVDATGMTVTITPSKNTSPILLMASGYCGTAWESGLEQRGTMQITDASNNAISGAQGTEFGNLNIGGVGAGLRLFLTPFTLIAYATPNTTSAVTYKMRLRTENASTTAYLFNALTTGQMFAIEVSA